MSETTYTQRWIRSHGVQPIAGWSLKRYTICHEDRPVAATLYAAAEAVVQELVEAAGQHPSASAVGFWGLHEAPRAAYLFVDWWVEQNELQHQLLRAELNQPRFMLVDARDPLACTWELRVIAHERDAWVRHFLANPVPSVADYLADGLTEYV